MSESTRHPGWRVLSALMAAVENEQGYLQHGSMDGPELAPYPPYVQTESDTRRWDAAYGIAEGLSRLFEESGEADARWVWYTTRALYNERSIATGDGDEIQEAALEHAGEADRLLRELESRVPADPADAAQLDDYLEALSNFFDGLLGDPDEWIPEEAEPDYSHEIAAAALDEVAAHVPGTLVHKPYNPVEHPRQRGGKWARKLKAAHAVLRDHPDKVEEHLTKGKTEKEKGRLRQKLHNARVIGVGTAQRSIADAIIASNPLHLEIEKHEKKSGRKNVATAVVDTVLPDPRDSAAGRGTAASHPSQDILDDQDRVRLGVEKSLDAARWAHDHGDVLKAAGRVAHAVAKSKGLVNAADLADEDLVALEANAEGADVHGAMIALFPPKAVQEKLAAHLKGGEPADQIHLTLVFLGPDAAKLEGEDKIREAVAAAAQAQAPLKGEVGGVAAFRGMPDGDLRPIIATADVVGLNEFRARLMDELEKRGVKPDETHGFTPHLTLKYAPKADPVPEPPEALPLDFGEVTLVWDEQKKNYPLSGS